jgi:hypothetical protein
MEMAAVAERVKPTFVALNHKDINISSLGVCGDIYDQLGHPTMDDLGSEINIRRNDQSQK